MTLACQREAPIGIAEDRDCGASDTEPAPTSLPSDGIAAHMGAMSDGALVLFSGGQDSTACLAWALDRYDRVETVGFDYGQRHGVELQARQTVRDRIAAEFPAWRPRLGPDHMLDLKGFGAVAE